MATLQEIKEFQSFLKKKGISDFNKIRTYYEKFGFPYNIGIPFDKFLQKAIPAELIITAFDFDLTDEGWDFWLETQKEWSLLCEK